VPAACADHAPPARSGLMIHTMAQARPEAARWLSYIGRYRSELPPGFLAGLVLDDGPPCCPSAGLARHVMHAAYRELTAGEGGERPAALQDPAAVRAARLRASRPDIEPEPRPAGGWYQVGGASVHADWAAGHAGFISKMTGGGCPARAACCRWVAQWAVFGRRGGTLLVRYEGGHVRGTEHSTRRNDDDTGWYDEPALWVDAGAFSTVEIYAQFRPAKETRRG
jgi:hypothetical protein